MEKSRLNIDFPSDDYNFLKMLCAKKGVSIKDFILPSIYKLMEDEIDAILGKKAQSRLDQLDRNDLIPIKHAFELAGWHEKKVRSTVTKKLVKRTKKNCTLRKIENRESCTRSRK